MRNFPTSYYKNRLLETEYAGESRALGEKGKFNVYPCKNDDELALNSTDTFVFPFKSIYIF